MRRVSDQVALLEKEQVRRGVGMTRSSKDTANLVFPDLALRKHGNDDLASAIRKR
jgi:hypothetical protein